MEPMYYGLQTQRIPSTGRPRGFWEDCMRWNSPSVAYPEDDDE
jgi:hypothetical protein